jgi:hypothetical protein
MTNDNEPKIGDLVMLIGRLIHQLNKFEPENPITAKAMDYLRRKNLSSAILREFMPVDDRKFSRLPELAE